MCGRGRGMGVQRCHVKVEAGGQAVPCGGDVVVLTAIRRREAMGLGQVQTQVVALYASGSLPVFDAQRLPSPG